MRSTSTPRRASASSSSSSSTGNYHLVVDMERVEFLDSTGLGVLVGGLKRVRAHDGSLDLVCTQERILKIFRITGLTKVFGDPRRRWTRPSPPEGARSRPSAAPWPLSKLTFTPLPGARADRPAGRHRGRAPQRGRRGRCSTRYAWPSARPALVRLRRTCGSARPSPVRVELTDDGERFEVVVTDAVPDAEHGAVAGSRRRHSVVRRRRWPTARRRDRRRRLPDGVGSR